VGPRNLPTPPGHGFPLWYQDLNGLVLDLCLPNASDPGNLQGAICLMETPPPYTFPASFPGESFYFRGTADLPLPGGLRAVFVSAVEAAFAQEVPAVNDGVVFTRLRVTAGLPEAGNYLFIHPWGVHPETVDAVTGARDVVWTEDVGIGAPGDFTGALRSQFGPFLSAAATAGGPALPPVTVNGAQFLADAPTAVTGSPFNTNYFMVCGTRPNGTFIPLGTDVGPNGNNLCARIDQFTLTGRLHDNVAQPIGSPLTIQAATYSRDAAGTHVNVGAQVARVLPTQPVPLLTAASNQTPPVRLQGPDVLDRYFAQGFTDPSGTLPGQITVTNSGDNPPTSVLAATKDVVTIASASYNATTQTLTAVATSSDKGFGAELPPTMAFEGFATTATPGGIAGDVASMTLVATGVAVPPTQVIVVSTAGGIGRVDLTTDPNLANPAGSPFARPDTATVQAGAPAIVIPVLANDLANAAAPINPASLTILAPNVTPAALGTAVANADGTITFTPGAQIGDATIRYTVSSAAVPGASNIGFVTVTLTEPAGGFVPLATADSALTITNRAFNINVLGNDSGNGGTLNPASVTIVPGSVTGGTATVNADGTVRFAAGATTGTTFGFNYTVANTNGNVSPSTRVAVRVRTVEALNTVLAAECRRGTGNRWRVSLGGVEPGTQVTFRTGTTPGAGTLIGTANSVGGTAALDVSGGVACGATTMNATTTAGSVRRATTAAQGNTTALNVTIRN
jgi:Bacterial Ig domain/Bacterial cadherin-like domain